MLPIPRIEEPVMTEDILLVEKHDGLATLTLNRPSSMNALSIALRSALCEAFDGLKDDPDTRVVIVTGAGDRAFCAGLDLKELGGETGPSDGVGAAVGGGANLVKSMERFDRPIIGAINGVAITGGFELALCCDVLIGSTNARFADTHARVGIMPGWGLSQKLSRLIGIYRAKELSLTGNFVSAEQAEHWGLLNRVVEPAELMGHCRALADDMMSCQPEMVSAYKRVIDRGFAATYEEGRRIELAVNREHRKNVTPGAIASARKQVTARGREQTR
jgi:enoyl-CoA hydratase